MSTAPTRTRSLRKPASEGSRHEKSTTVAPVEAPQSRERGNVSPSRLPKPPVSTIAPTGLSRKTSISRPGTSNSNSNATARSSSQRTGGVSRPPLTSENRTSTLRNGARTPTESNSSLQRSSNRGHARTSSTSALPTNASARPPSASSSYRGHTRTASTATNIIPSASTTLRPPSSSSTHPEQTKASNTATHHRPAFSTLQQHFSPLKSFAPKPPTSTFLAPPSPSKHPIAIHQSTEIARLQTQLLQLHLLHESLAPTTSRYRTSAHQKLHARFDDVVSTHTELVEWEQQEQDRVNAIALKAWAQGGVGWGLDEKVQMLDTVLAGVWKLGEPGGRYLRLIKRFERWLNGVWDLLQRRRDGDDPNHPNNAADGNESLDVPIIAELDTEWKEERRLLARKISEYESSLRDLGDVQGRSSLASVVGGLRALVQGMAAEVALMERLEREVMRREEVWIRDAVAADDEDDDEDAEVPGAVWRALRGY